MKQAKAFALVQLINEQGKALQRAIVANNTDAVRNWTMQMKHRLDDMQKLIEDDHGKKIT